MRLSEAARDEIRAHATEESPREACGFLVGTGEVLRARNASPEPEKGAAADPATSLEAYGRGVVATYHSHPCGPEGPSALDRSACTMAGVPSVVYSLPSDHFSICEPRPRWELLIERRWAWGSADCLELVRDYYRLCHGVEIDAFPRPCAFESFPPRGFDFALAVRSRGFVAVVGAPRAGDLLLARLRSSYPNHLGVLLGEQVLHHPVGALSRTSEYAGAWLRRSQVFRHPRVECP